MAGELYHKAPGAQHRVFDDDHPQTLTSMNGLGALHTKKKQYDEVEPLLIGALEGCRFKLGGPCPHTLASTTT